MTNKYLMQKRVKTPIYTFEKSEFREFTFESYEDSHSHKGDLLVSRVLEAPDGNHAMRQFFTELEPILNSISILIQTIIFPLPTGSHMLYKLTNNPGNLFYANIASDREIVGMSLESEMFEDVEKLLSIGNSVALSYLRDAIGTLSSVQQLSMLLSAAEALAGTSKTKGVCKKCGEPYTRSSTDKERLKTILGDELYKKLYTDGLRHKLAHGGDFDGEAVAETAGKTYSRINLGYLKETYDLSSLQEIHGAPRSFVFEYSHHGAKMLSSDAPTLKLVESEWDSPTSFAFSVLPTDY
jgi:hypothetical protein